MKSLRTFCKDRFEPWAKATFEDSSPKSWLWYRTGIRALQSYKKIADVALDSLTGESASEFASHRIGKKLQISTVNFSLRVLRSILHRAVAIAPATSASGVAVTYTAPAVVQAAGMTVNISAASVANPGIAAVATVNLPGG